MLGGMSPLNLYRLSPSSMAVFCPLMTDGLEMYQAPNDDVGRENALRDVAPRVDALPADVRRDDAPRGKQG